MTETKEIVTTLKAEIVNDVVIEKNGNSYSSDFECEIAVKVGNKVENLTWEFGKDYKSDDRTPVAHMDNRSKEKFDALIQAGIEIDYSDVKEAYLNAIEVCRLKIEQDKIDAAKQRKMNRAKFYDNSWVKAFTENVDGDKRFEMKDYYYSFLDRQKYIDGNEELFVTINYNGIAGIFKYSEYFVSSAHSFRSKPEMKYNVCNGFKKREDGTIEKLLITDDKERKAKLPKSVVHRWFSDVDEYLAIQKSRIARLTKEENDRKEFVKFLSEKSGLEVEPKREYKWRESRHGGGYYSWEYNIKFTPIGEEKEKTFKINYNDYHKTFTIDGLSGLNENQFGNIIKVLRNKVQ